MSFEKNPYEGGNDPFRVRCLYERALVDNPLNESLWDDYIKYLSDVVKIPEDTMHACRRAIRNCPREEEFWCHLMILMEKSNRPRQEITGNLIPFKFSLIIFANIDLKIVLGRNAE